MAERAAAARRRSSGSMDTISVSIIHSSSEFHGGGSGAACAGPVLTGRGSMLLHPFNAKDEVITSAQSATTIGDFISLPAAAGLQPAFGVNHHARITEVTTGAASAHATLFTVFDLAQSPRPPAQ